MNFNKILFFMMLASGTVNTDQKYNIAVITSTIDPKSLHKLLEATIESLDTKTVQSSSFTFNVTYISPDTPVDLMNLGRFIRKNPHTVAVIGPEFSSDIILFHPFAVLMNIPQLAPTASDTMINNKDRFPNLLRLEPSYDLKIRSILDVVKFFGWKSIGIFANRKLFFQHVKLQFMMKAKDYNLEVVISKLVSSSSDIELALKDTMKSGQHVIIIVCPYAQALEIMDKAYRNEMNNKDWVWIFWEGENLTLDFSDKLMSLIAVQEAHEKGPMYKPLMENIEPKNISDTIGIHMLKYAESLLSVVYGIDNILKSNETFAKKKLLTSILENRQDNHGILSESINFNPETMECSHMMKYNIFALFDNRWTEIGEWVDDAKTNLEMYSEPVTKIKTVLPKVSYLPDLKYVTLKVLIMEAEPFVSFGYSSLQENLSTFVPSGYCVDLFKMLSKDLGFKYDIIKSNATTFGSRDEISGIWNGIIGELVYGEYDMILAPVTVTSERSSVIDLTNTFAETSLKIIFDQNIIDGEEDVDRFSFLLPFDKSLYYALGLSILAVAVYLTLVSRFSPYGAHGRFFQSEEAENITVKQEIRRQRSSVANFGSKKQSLDMPMNESLVRKSSILRRKASVFPAAENGIVRSKFSGFDASTPADEDENTAVKNLQTAERYMSFSNALYFACAGLLWQSPENVPRAPSARVVAGVWYMIGVIIVASYTANLVTFISKKSTTLNLNTVHDFSLQEIIPVATMADSSVNSLLKSSRLPLAERIYENMLRNPETCLQTNMSEVLEQINTGKLAFIWESLEIDNLLHNSQCSLKAIDMGFGRISYAFALKRGSSYTNQINRQLLILKQNGFMDHLREKHFNFTNCEQPDDGQVKHLRLPYARLAGVFDMLIFGSLISLIILTVEWLVAAFCEVDKANPKRPADYLSSLILRLRRLKMDVCENWIPLKDTRNHWSKFRSNTRSHSIAIKPSCVQPDQWKRFKASERVSSVSKSLSEMAFQ